MRAELCQHAGVFDRWVTSLHFSLSPHLEKKLWYLPFFSPLLSPSFGVPPPRRLASLPPRLTSSFPWGGEGMNKKVKTLLMEISCKQSGTLALPHLHVSSLRGAHQCPHSAAGFIVQTCVHTHAHANIYMHVHAGARSHARKHVEAHAHKFTDRYTKAHIHK